MSADEKASEIGKWLIKEVGGEPRYYKDRSFKEKNSMILLINGTKENVKSEAVTDIIISCLYSFNLKIDSVENGNIIFLKKGGDIISAVLNESLLINVNL